MIEEVTYKTWMCLICGFIYDETAALIRYGQSKLVGIVGSFQAIAARNLPRLRTIEMGLA